MADLFDVEVCHALALRAEAGDATALASLIERLWPAWLQMIAADRSMRSLHSSEDDIRTVAIGLVEKLQKRQGHTLHLYRLWLERHPSKDFSDWMRIVTKNAVRNHVAARLGSAPRDDGPSPKRLLNEYSSSKLLEEIRVTPKITASQTARELLEFAEVHLPAGQRRALTLWLQGMTFDDIALDLGVQPGEALRLQRAAVASLRREFSSTDREARE